MRVVVAAGGTGGHIYPGIAIAKYIISKHPDANIIFVGTDKGLEKDIVPKEGFEIKLIRVKGFERRLSIDTLQTIKQMFLGLSDAKKIIKDLKPDIVIGTGGYVCGPVLFAAWQEKVPTLIHEQNAFPGVTNKILSKFVDKVAVSFPEAISFFKDKKKVIVSGNPIRNDFKDNDRKRAREKLNIPFDAIVIVATGGSQGALTINKSMVEVVKKYNNQKNVYIIHVTGNNQYEDIIKMYREQGIITHNNINTQIIAYSYDMPNLLKACDLIISRAGAVTVSEICAIGRASILIPFPFATDNHQEFNAKVITDKKGGILILNKDLNGSTLIDSISEIIGDKEKLILMERISSELGILNGDETIYNEIKNLV
ncbi:undecaprenyldiphospho-muramoylpentapeptide beta-N-acetylglucosaminyltransferase [Alkalibaculum sp. M08DMB]|uniref:UDP-N-acetylglucosamine--N-acetylmuramyl-(pentapeptide) pyrophosphoryl-undecaprenol N-acetylglucosamine transferase n=1 Tax=Alkalibaculum sporogenes TaxID=2655001 RepID=A0A6A7K770_9FIRM|nr:undecaprenyldiphospho-muramoylpentapeptide beta-N-acetylglucosaminyltransferase [Alkalibaculum sporogenes]MPW25181.1 undecaprenyldiphospho-muramoylpentapeptide beta-N-acetylglucosaminyltransferase [Alkalibaculum sporogenes]